MKVYKHVKILEKKMLSNDIYDMTLETGFINAQAGQFMEIYIDNNANILPRPISICEIKQDTLRIVFQTVGVGTKYFAGLEKGDSLRIMAPLGNGFTNRGYKKVALVGGGIGVPPLKQLYNELECEKSVFLGFRSNPVLENEFGNKVYIATDDGSHGYHGNVVSLLRDISPDIDCIYACGPKIMLKYLTAYAAERSLPCFVSMEERMACGFGVCVGCALKIKRGDDFVYKKVCTDGPVFNAEEVIWDD